MTEQYDVVVIGGGPAGNAIASGLQAQGKSVLIVEADLWGGTCPNRGCDPKKILLSAVEAQQAAQHLQHQGLTGTPTIDWPALMAHKRGYTDGINDGTLKGLQHQGIATLHGQAHFQNDGLQLTAPDFELTTDLVISSAGRIPNADQLGLENVGVTFNRHGIQVNDRLQTANPHIYAIGDVSDTPVPKLTPVAGYEARYLVQQLTQPGAAITYPVIPTQVFAVPKLAQVGLSATDAADQPDKYRVNTLDMTKWFSYYRFGARQAQAKVIIDQASGQVVGATLLSDVADEMINYLTLLIEKHVTLAQLQQLVLAYPTPASDLQYLY